MHRAFQARMTQTTRSRIHALALFVLMALCGTGCATPPSESHPGGLGLLMDSERLDGPISRTEFMRALGSLR